MQRCLSVWPTHRTREAAQVFSKLHQLQQAPPLHLLLLLLRVSLCLCLVSSLLLGLLLSLLLHHEVIRNGSLLRVELLQLCLGLLGCLRLVLSLL